MFMQFKINTNILKAQSFIEMSKMYVIMYFNYLIQILCGKKLCLEVFSSFLKLFSIFISFNMYFVYSFWNIYNLCKLLL